MYIIKAYTGDKTGWKEIKRFNNSTDAQFWLTAYARLNGYSVSDFTIKVI